MSLLKAIAGSRIFIGYRVAPKSRVTLADFDGHEWTEIKGWTQSGQLGDTQELVQQASISRLRTMQAKGTRIGQAFENTFLPVPFDPGQDLFRQAIDDCGAYAFKVEWGASCGGGTVDNPQEVDYFYGLATPGTRAGGDANTVLSQSWTIAVDSNVVEASDSGVPQPTVYVSPLGFLYVNSSGQAFRAAA